MRALPPIFTGYERVYRKAIEEHKAECRGDKIGKCKDVLAREKAHNRYHEFQTYSGICHGERTSGDTMNA